MLHYKEAFAHKRVKDKNGTRRQWMMRDHYYNLDGHIIWAKDEYEYKK